MALKDYILLDTRPNCDLCLRKTPAFFDGKTIMGPWAYMCEGHFATHGCGLGEGKGQRVIVPDLHGKNPARGHASLIQ
jgi:hypothetical protein